MAFSGRRAVDPLSPSVTVVLDFLAELFAKESSYSKINTARSALSTFIFIDGKSVGSHPLVKRLLKGVFNKRPALPKHKFIWDVAPVLSTLEKLHPVKDISLRALTLKLVMLLALLSGQRIQTFHGLNLRDLFFDDDKLIIKVNFLLKTSKPGKHLQDIIIKAFLPNQKLCLLTVIKEYLKRTFPLRGNEQKLFISYVKPYKAVSKSTIGRWLCKVLTASGIDTSLFTAHSTRAASVSAAKKAAVPIQAILSAAGWQNSAVFAKFYDKSTVSTDGTFGTSILEKFS